MFAGLLWVGDPNWEYVGDGGQPTAYKGGHWQPGAQCPNWRCFRDTEVEDWYTLWTENGPQEV